MTAIAEARVNADQILCAENVGVFYGEKQAVKDVNVGFRKNTVNALIGPSGCGKTTFLRAINRMHDLTPGARVIGKFYLDGQDLYSSEIDPVDVRRRVGMVFQKPNPFPTMSIYDNVVAGLKLAGERFTGSRGAIQSRGCGTLGRSQGPSQGSGLEFVRWATATTLHRSSLGG
jgi:ABC-type phosphate transport system ATPase subunit